MDLNHAASGLNQFRNFDWKQGLELNAAEFTIERAAPRYLEVFEGLISQRAGRPRIKAAAQF